MSAETQLWSLTRRMKIYITITSTQCAHTPHIASQLTISMAFSVHIGFIVSKHIYGKKKFYYFNNLVVNVYTHTHTHTHTHIHTHTHTHTHIHTHT